MFTTIPRRLPGRPPADADTQLRLDHSLPAYDAVSRRHAVVDAPPREAYEAALAADLTRLGPVVAALGALRALPGCVDAWLRGSAAASGSAPATEPEPESFTFGTLPTSGTWVRLADAPGEEFVFGAVGRPWKPDVEWVVLSADEFRAFDRPGYAKMAAGLSFRPYGRERTLVTYEARTRGTDPLSTWLFTQYWRFVSPFVGYILSRVLARVARDVEASTRPTD